MFGSIMRLQFSVVVSAVLLAGACPAHTAVAQNFIPKTIQFKGVPDYTDAELSAAAGLKPGETLTSADVNQRSQKLMDTGLFHSLAFTFDGQDLIFKLTPEDEVFPVRLVNFPFVDEAEVENKLRNALPLYRGKVPGEGGMLDGVRSALEEVLKAKGIDANVIAAPFNDPVQHKITGMSFSISSPAVVIGAVKVEPEITLEKDAANVVAQLPGKPFDSEGSKLAIEKYVADAYQDKGYLEAEVETTQQADLAIEPYTVRVPFRVAIKPGALYHVSSIHLAPGMVVTQADFDKQANVHTGDVADAIHIQRNWDYIKRQYHNRGYVKAHIDTTPALDRAQGTVAFEVTAIPGPVYTMGTLSIVNPDANVQAVVRSAWTLKPGDVFNEGTIISMTATNGVNRQSERLFAVANVKYKLQLNDESKTVDVVLTLEKKQP
jgi:outer membrane protein assembly factor BamA